MKKFSLLIIFCSLCLFSFCQKAGKNFPDISRIFPDECAWYQRVDSLPVDPNTDSLIYNTVYWKNPGANGNISTIGAWPVNFISNVTPTIRLIDTCQYNCAETYPTFIPDLTGMVMQNGDYSSDWRIPDFRYKRDHHLIVYDAIKKTLYELYQPRHTGPNGEWECLGGAVWDLTKCDQRPLGTTSADAAGLPLLPFLITPYELEQGEIRHALRITVSVTLNNFIYPATHHSNTGPSTGNYLPMGARVRLKKTFDSLPFIENKTAMIIIRCLYKYGAIVADNGNSFSITAVRDTAMDKFEHCGGIGTDGEWHSINLSNNLKCEKWVTAFDLEVVKMGPMLMAQNQPPACKNPRTIWCPN